VFSVDQSLPWLVPMICISSALFPATRRKSWKDLFSSEAV